MGELINMGVAAGNVISLVYMWNMMEGKCYLVFSCQLFLTVFFWPSFHYFADDEEDAEDFVWQIVTVNVDEYLLFGDPTFRRHFRLTKPLFELSIDILTFLFWFMVFVVTLYNVFVVDFMWSTSTKIMKL